MNKILLKTDVDAIDLKNLREDVSLLRDILVTIVREYHLKGDDKYDFVKGVAESCLSVAEDAREQVESAKNDTAEFERVLREFEEEYEHTRTTVSNLVTKFNTFVAEYDNHLNKVRKDHEILMSSMGGNFDEENINVGTLAVRLANLIKEVDKLKKRKGFLGLFSK